MENLRVVAALLLTGCALHAQKPAEKKAAPPAAAASSAAALAEELRGCVLAVVTSPEVDRKFAPALALLRDNAEALAENLKSRSNGPLKAPPEYLASLRAEIEICRPMLMTLTVNSPFANSDGRARLDALSRDLGAKAIDARNNASARLVPVEVLTRHRALPDNGWTITYQWLPGSAKQSKTFPAPTPGAKTSLPPGYYSFRAEKTVAGKQTTVEGGSGALGGIPAPVISINIP